MAFWDCVVCVCMASDATGRQSVMWICRSNSGLGHGTNNFPPHLSQHAKIVNHDDLLRTPYIKHNANFCINQTMRTKRGIKQFRIPPFSDPQKKKKPTRVRKLASSVCAKKPYSNTIKERIASRCCGETYNKGNDARESRKRDLYRYPYPYPYISHPMTRFSPVSYIHSRKVTKNPIDMSKENRERKNRVNDYVGDRCL